MLAPSDWIKNLQINRELSLKIGSHCCDMVGRHAGECFKWTSVLIEEMAAEEVKFEQIVNEAKMKNSNPQTLPTVVNLRTRTESFLDHAQTGLIEASKFIDMLVLPIKCARNYTNILQFLGSKLKANDPLIEVISANKDSLKSIASLRNAARHDAGLDGQLSVFNYTRKPADPFGYEPPGWKLNSEPAEPLRESTVAIAEFVIAFSERLLIACLCHHPSAFPLRWEVIPQEHRNPAMPFAFELQCKLGNQWVRFG
jgi:hypothetical protein